MVKKIPLTDRKKRWAQNRVVTLRGTRLAYNVSQRVRYQSTLQRLIRKMILDVRKQVMKLFSSQKATKFVKQQKLAQAMDAELLNTAATRLMNSLKKTFSQLFNSEAKPIAQEMVEGAAKSSAVALKSSLKKLSGGLSLKTGVVPAGLEDISASIVSENVSLIKSIPVEYLDDVSGAVFRSITTGSGLADLIPELAKYDGVTMRRAKNIAHDQTRKAYNFINKSRLLSLGTRQFQWVHSGGGQQPRASHIKISGTVFSFENLEAEQAALGVPEADRGIPGKPINCFLGSTEISLADGCSNLWRYRHEGNIVCIKMFGGASMECTMNHPILTLRGWLSANDIQQGDYLVSSQSDDVRTVDDKHAEYKITFDQFFESQNMISKSESSVGSKFNFYGDIPRDNVDAIRIENKLSNSRYSATNEQIEKLIFSFSDVIRNTFIPSFDSEIFKFGLSSIFSKNFTFFEGKFRQLKTGNSASISQDDPTLAQNASNDLSTDVIRNSNRENIFSVSISSNNLGCIRIDPISVSHGRQKISEADFQSLRETASTARMSFGEFAYCHSGIKKLLRVEKKIIRKFSGHVYTMESCTGRYTVTASEIISKNCGCTMLPVIRFDDED